MSSVAPSADPLKRYTSVQVLLIHYNGGGCDVVNARHLKRAFESLGYQVTTVMEDELGTDHQGAVRFFRGWIEEQNGSITERDNLRLFIICFLGHGASHRGYLEVL